MFICMPFIDKMNGLVTALRTLQIRAEVASLMAFTRSDFHTSAVLCKKIKRAPKSKNELPEPIKTSWGQMVYRGMIPREPVTEYTIEPLPVKKTGGRGVTGRIEIRRIGGGKPVVWHMTDLNRITETEPDPKVEIIREIIPEQTRSAHIALVASGNKKRWIVATETMKVGDIITSTRELPPIAIQGTPGDCYPVGALAVGTQICCVERYPYGGSKVANGAGTSAMIVKKIKDKVTIRMPSKREMVVDEKCLCVCGKVSNIDRNKVKLGKAGAARWLGIRPKSGLWLRKTGLAGRKIKPIRKPRVYLEPEVEPEPEKTFTLRDDVIFKGKPMWYSAF